MTQAPPTVKTSSVPRLTSGLPGLDTLLNGGFISGGMYLLLGPPGSGKTVLGNQICFHHAREGRGNVVYLTLLAESHSRMIENLRVFDYFREELVGQQLHYLSGYQALEKEGLSGLHQLIASVIRQHRATMLMIDGIATIGDIDQTSLAFRRFTHELNTYAALSGCTTFLLSSMEGLHSKPEHTMVDGILAMHHENSGLRSLRHIEVRKFRGSSHLDGKHFLSIGDGGMQVVPRLESLKATVRPAPGTTPPSRARLPLSVPGLDEMLGGGVIQSSVTTLIGAAGVGKTLLALHFLQAGAAQGEQGIYFGFAEAPDELVEKASALELDVRHSVERGLIEILWYPALEQELDELGEALLQSVRRTRAKRVVIDGVDGFRFSASNPARTGRFLIALILKLKAEGVTVVLIEETTLFREPGERQVAELSALNETLLYLRNVELEARMVRVISILKVRSAVYDPSVREFQIDPKGFRVLTAGRSARGIPTREARELGFSKLKRAEPKPKKRKK